MKPNIISEKSVVFAINMIKVYQSIIKAHNEYVLSKQFLRSSTAIGALVAKVGLTRTKLHLYKHYNKG